MKQINAILGAILTFVGLTGCGTVIKTQHHITLDHNININVNNFNIGLTHKHIDNNKTRSLKPQFLSMKDIISNIKSVDNNDTQ